ncbi:restriction endonuclease subunit S [Planktothrix agardhii]|jgi:type I restriction enzyme S subunit|uniref:restriction endonuclease subunit S n=1 Tax=Planktothrix agardhii TaxID=1160 RepID=UPI0028AC963F|nr:restriction endonuclease subunit S [Planktothrix agardhii]
MLINESHFTQKWSIVNLDEVVEFLDSQRKPITEKDRISGTYPYYGANGQQDLINDYIFDEPLVLLAEDGGHFGEPNRTIAYQINGKCWVNNHAHVLRPKNNINIRYLCRVLEHYDVSKYITGSTRAKLTKTSASQIKIPLPPIASQRRIANILDKADEIIRKRKEAIALTEQLQKSIFLDMFGDPVTNPKGWEKVTVNDVVSEVKDGPHVSPEYSHNGIPILSTRNIRPNELIMEDIKYISEDVYLNLIKRFKPQKGDVLLTKGGTTGFAKVVDWDWNFAVWVHLALLRPNNKIRSEFLEATLNSPNCYLQSQLYTHGIANKDLGLNRIRKIKMCLPPLDLQDEYCQIRKKTLFLLNKNKKSLKESENLFNSLLQKAFKGEL